MPLRRFLSLSLNLSLILTCLVEKTGAGELEFRRDPMARFAFGGFVGERVEANVEQWLIPAPEANPGMLEMFAQRDREPVPKLVPWAGEFAGKYLISAIQALRMSESAELRATVTNVVGRLIESQPEDGYLGPFRKEERLLGHWDLWGHYHCMLALLMWHEQTGDEAALNCARKAADLVCRTYLDSGRRALEAGSDEMNLAIIHSLGWLYRITKEPRYLRMMREIEKDWEKAGDYLRAGLNGVEFYRSPRPRWESLHNIQGLVELYRITGEEKYRAAFEHQWRSIARWDVRNTGGFSSGEQATGDPYANTPIETCCTIAWMALSTDMLALTGDSRAADLLELATFNAWAGAQHPSGRWCTYNTPMDGAREASAHTIVFQSRAGTPELNCCSVNGPRGWGMLVDWAAMRTEKGLVLNWLGPAEIETHLPDGSPVKLVVTGSYPSEKKVMIKVEADGEFPLLVRIPEWSKTTEVSVNGEAIDDVRPGAYLTLDRKWKHGDTIRLNLDFSILAVPGDKEMLGKVSLYRGPLLLAFDQKFNAIDPHEVPPIGSVENASVLPVEERQPRPLALVEVSAGGKPITLCDFATAGAMGTHYRSWLPSETKLPPRVVTRAPADGKLVPLGRIAFRWTGPGGPCRYRLEISEGENFGSTVFALEGLTSRQALVNLDERFRAERWYYWRIISEMNGHQSSSVVPAARFRVDPTRPLAEESFPPAPAVGAKGEILSADLRGKPEPDFGGWEQSSGWKAVAGPDGSGGAAVALNGVDQRLTYEVPAWGEENYRLTLRFRIKEMPAGRLGQIVSAWAGPMDDPLRVCVQNGQLYARMEAGGGFSTPGVAVEAGRWYSLEVKKTGARLVLFLDDRERASATVPTFINTRSRHIALGGNPRYPGNEFLAVELQDFSLYPGE